MNRNWGLRNGSCLHRSLAREALDALDRNDPERVRILLEQISEESR